MTSNDEHPITELMNELLRFIKVVLRMASNTFAVFGVLIMVLILYGYPVAEIEVVDLFLFSLALWGLWHLGWVIHDTISEHQYAKNCQCEVCKTMYPGPFITFIKSFFYML
jgi:hypothetical protein